MLQDWEAITNPPPNLAKVNVVALIVWDVFEARYGWGQWGAFVLLFPLGCAVFCGLHCATSAARCAQATTAAAAAAAVATQCFSALLDSAAPPAGRQSRVLLLLLLYVLSYNMNCTLLN